MEKLKWYKDTGYGQTELAVDEATIWETTYNGEEGLFSLEVYPIKLIDKGVEGWEYRIIEDNEEGTGEEYDSAFESSVGNDHALTAKEAMKWAENTLKDILEERRSKKEKV